MTLGDFERVANELIRVKEENQELKKQLEELEVNYKSEHNMRVYFGTQQKEFIKYLEDEISKWHNNYDSYNYEHEIEEPTAEELVNEILQKYKSIIGDDKQ